MGYTPSPSSGGGPLVFQEVTSFGAHVSAFGAPYSAPAAALASDGQVVLSGLLTVAGGAVASGGKLFDLPDPTMHPVKKKLISSMDANNPTVPLMMAVMPNGEVQAVIELLAQSDPVLDDCSFATTH